MKIIDDYLEQILYRQLKEINMPYRFIQQIQEDIRCRMLSCLFYWNQQKVRKTLLFLSLEEALFYEPANVQEEIREFIVTTIRNSMIEIAASDDCHIFKMPVPISNEQIKQITEEAIRYFNNYDMSILASKVEKIEVVKNVYIEAIEKYPLAWDILYQLANLDVQAMDITRHVEGQRRENLEKDSELQMETVVCNGFTLEFDETLKEIIGEVITDKANCFYVDCFKMISRNFEKVLHVLQIVLENNKVFCTCNYYISLNHLEKRKKILRAAHNTKDVIHNMNHQGAPSGIVECIRAMMGEE